MKNSVWIGLVLVFFPLTLAFAQKPANDEPVGMFASQQEYFDFMGAAKTAAQVDPELQAMIPLINDIALQQPIGTTARQYQTAGSPLGLLADPRIREDIEMVDGQYQELQSRNTEIQQRLSEQLRALDFTDKGNVARQLQSMRDMAENDLNAVLLPHQLTRLRQIRIRSELRGRSFVELLVNDPLKSELEITDDQRTALQTAEREIEAELRKEIVRLREKARERLLGKLTATQREKVEELFGDAIEFSDPDQLGSGDDSRGRKNNKK